MNQLASTGENRQSWADMGGTLWATGGDDGRFMNFEFE
jgi:hypothetical protein